MSQKVNTNTMITDLYGYLDEPRFTILALAGATIKTLVSLKTDSCVGLMMDSKAAVLWKTLVDSKPLNTAEREIIDQAIANLRTGISTLGQSYEEMAVAKGTKVTYSPEATYLTPASKEMVTIPNFPVPPPPKVIPRPSQEWIDPWVVANFDIQAGKVVEIRLESDLRAIWDSQYSRINFSGFHALLGTVEKIVATSPQWEDLRSQGRSCSGLAFFDLWTTACATCNYEQYLVLHDTIITKCLAQVRVREVSKTENKVKVVKALNLDQTKSLPFPMSTLKPLSSAGCNEEELAAIQRFRAKTKHSPLFLNGPISAILKFVSPKENDAVQAVSGFHRVVKTFGAKKRGLGKLFASWNYAPRMSRVWREINMLVALLGEVTGFADIRVTAGAFVLLLAHLKRQPDTEHRILLSYEQTALMASVPMSEQHLLIMSPRQDSTIVYVERKPQVPTFDAKKPEAAKSILKTSYDTWRRSLPDHDFVVSTVVYCPDAFSHYHVYSIGSNFDLSAVVSSYSLTGGESMLTAQPTSADFFGMAIQEMRPILMWWHAPEKTYSTLGSQFSPPQGTLMYSEEGGFRMVPDFDFGGADAEEDVDVDEEEFSAEYATDEGESYEEPDKPENSSVISEKIPPEKHDKIEKMVGIAATLPQPAKVESAATQHPLAKTGADPPAGKKATVVPKRVWAKKKIIEEEESDGEDANPGDEYA